MDIETITKLLDAGYTKEEISALETEPAGNETSGNAGKDNEDAGEKPSNAGAENAGAVESTELTETIKVLTDTVDGLVLTVKAMQDANIKGAKGGKSSADPIGETMKSFIDKL